jgi:hypothetical protein
MPQTFLVFDFGTNEEAAQQARHRLEAWKQALHLGDRLKFKFERQAPEPPAEPPAEAEAEPAKGKGKSKSKKKEAESAAAAEPAGDRLRVLVRLEFSDHEKLSYQRWVDRIPAEAPFPSAEKQVVHRGQEGFEKTATLFDELP